MRDQQKEADRTSEIIWLIRRLMQAQDLYSKALDKAYNVSSCQLACLLSLHEKGPMPTSQIARHVLVNSSTVTGVIDRLERKKLVQRSRGSTDRRVITITLTGAGRRLAETAPPPVEKKIVEGLKKMPHQEMEQILAGMGKLTKLLDLYEYDEGGLR
ncbi:MAG: MarR family transcriptional regulator [Pseudomonadota bacterium]